MASPCIVMDPAWRKQADGQRPNGSLEFVHQGVFAALKPVRWKRWNTYLLLAGSAHFALFYTLNTRPMLNLPAFEAGAERAPFQYRALTAWIYAVADCTLGIPERLRAHLPPSMSTVDDFVTLLLAFLSLLIAGYATRLALERLTAHDDVWSRWGALLVLPMGYYHYLLEFGHPCCTPLQLPYDLPSLAFFAVALALIVGDRIAWLYPAFALATLNRESSVFLIILFGLYRSAEFAGARFSSRRALTTGAHIAGLTAVWFAVRELLHHLFHPQAVPGVQVGGFEIHILDNLGYLLRPYYWTSFLSLFGFTWLFIYAHWREVPNAGVRRMLWIGPIYLAAMYIVGVLSEIRIFGELIPLYAIAFTLLLRSMLAKETSFTPRTLNPLR